MGCVPQDRPQVSVLFRGEDVTERVRSFRLTSDASGRSSSFLADPPIRTEHDVQVWAEWRGQRHLVWCSPGPTTTEDHTA